MKKRVDEPTYKKFITGPIKRFDESNHCYSRGSRGEIPAHREIADTMLKKRERNVPGYSPEDYALQLGSRFVNYILRRVSNNRQVPEIVEIGHKPRDANGEEITPAKFPVKDPAAMSARIKKVAKWFDADLTGICKINMDWVYSHWGTHSLARSGINKVGQPVELPEEYKYVIVMATEMDYKDIQRSPAVCSSIDLAYSMMDWTAGSVAQYIRELGYGAIPAGNEMSLTVPQAADAGLGEMGRNGLLITDEFGPRVRLSKVFTSLPLMPDKPIDLGAQSFCEKCERCAEACPGNAIKSGERTDKAWGISNASGVLKWPCNSEKCLNFWVRNGTWCSNCIRVCPWNKPKGWLHSAVKRVVAHTHVFDSLFVKIDSVLGYGKQVLTEL